MNQQTLPSGIVVKRDHVQVNNVDGEPIATCYEVFIVLPSGKKKTEQPLEALAGLRQNSKDW
jgi:hypothetical protein